MFDLFSFINYVPVQDGLRNDGWKKCASTSGPIFLKCFYQIVYSSRDICFFFTL